MINVHYGYPTKKDVMTQDQLIILTKIAQSEDDTLYLSSDMQKVILIPRLPGYKVCLFTKRMVVINQSFAPIATADVQQKKPWVSCGTRGLPAEMMKMLQVHSLMP